MPDDDSVPTLFDELLDRTLRGEEIDAERILRAHPEISAEERRQILKLCGSSSGGGASREERAPTAADGRLPVERIGHHRLVRRIGVGAMGAVFLADDEALGREVAIKILGPDILGTGERADRFLREARAAARLRHPNIVTVHSAGEEDGLRYMVMELVPGRSLQEVLAEAAGRGARVPVPDVLRTGAEVARALHAAHEAGIIHRDVKPSNIRIHEDGRAILLDFGLARDVGDATLTETGAFRGSPQYASPEQVDPAARPLDARTDVYSLGATLYEMLTGAAPFRAESRAQLFQAILTRDPVPPRRVDPAIPRDLETVVLAALDKDPAHRHPTAAALAADLEAVGDGRPVSVRPPSAAGRLARWVRRHPARAALAAVLAIAVPAIAGLGGFVAANLGKIEEAESAARARALADLLETAYLEFGEGDPSGAGALFEEAVRAEPASPEALAGLAFSRIESGDAAGALALLDGFPEPWRGAAWAGRLRWLALLRLGRAGDAKATEAALPKPSTAADHFVCGFLELDRVHRGAPEGAQIGFEALWGAVLLAPNPLYHSELGHAAMHAGRHVEARQIAAAIEQLRPESPERWFAVGRTLKFADPEAAARALEKAATPPPRSLAARDFIVGTLATTKPTPARLELAVKLGRESVRLAPGRPWAHNALALALEATGDADGAIAAWREAVRIEPGYFDGWRNLSRVLVDRGDVEASIPALRKVASIAPGQKRSWDRLGIALSKHGDYDEAAAAFEKALKIAPDDPSLLCNLGTALLRSGRFAEAREFMRKGHEIGSKTKGWSYPSAKWVAECELRVAVEARREQILKGATPTLEERIRIARLVCRPKRLWVEAFEHYTEAFSEDTSLPSQADPDYLLEAAAAGIHGSAGRGVGSPEDPERRAALRRRVLDLLAAALSEMEDIVGDAAPTAAAVAANRAAFWLTEPELAHVGPRSDFGGIPAEEATSWRGLWARCEAIAPASRPASRPLLTR